MAWRFYVYALTKDGEVVYVGKGSGYRLAQQKRNKGCDGYEIARFLDEKDAYGFERQTIIECKPALNRNLGGGGSWATCAPLKRVSKRSIERHIREIERVGTRRYAARLLLSLSWPFTASEIEGFRRVAYG